MYVNKAGRKSLGEIYSLACLRRLPLAKVALGSLFLVSDEVTVYFRVRLQKLKFKAIGT